MLEKQIQKTIDKLSEEIENEQDKLVTKRQRMLSLKKQLSEMKNNHIVGKFYKFKSKNADKGMIPDYWIFIKILDFYSENRVYIESFHLSYINYNKRKQVMFNYTKNDNTFISNLERPDYIEISEDEYNEQLKLHLQRVQDA